jgi:hypothetical protein
MAEAGTEMPIPTAKAMPVQQQTPIATATATPVQQQVPIATATATPVQQQTPIATATAVPVAQAGHGSAPTFQRQPTFAARATRGVKQQPLHRKLCCGFVGVLALVLIVLAIVRTLQGCGCPPGYTDTTSCTDTCSCSCDGNIWGCSYECGGDVCFEAGSEISCATGSPVDNTPSETKSARNTPCICKEQWSIAGYENCGVTQNGCEPTSCDGDAPWCKVKNPGCDEEEKDPDSYGEGWAYCTTDSASSGSVQ